MVLFTLENQEVVYDEVCTADMEERRKPAELPLTGMDSLNLAEKIDKTFTNGQVSELTEMLSILHQYDGNDKVHNYINLGELLLKDQVLLPTKIYCTYINKLIFNISNVHFNLRGGREGGTMEEWLS